MARPCAGSWGRRKQQPRSLQCFAALALIAALHAATVLAQAPIPNQGWGVALDGSTTSAIQTPPLSLNLAFSFEGWFYATRTPTEDSTQLFAMSGKYTGQDYTVSVAFTSGELRFMIANAANGWSADTAYNAANWPLNTWVYVAAVHDGVSNDLLSINGGAFASGGGTTLQYPTPGGGPNVNTGLVVGGPVGSASCFQGRIDEVRVWNYARTLSEVQAGMYASMPPGAAGLIAYYTFDEGRPVRKMQDYARKTGDLTLPAGAAMYYPGAPHVGSFAGFNALAEFSGNAALTIDGGARVCFGACP